MKKLKLFAKSFKKKVKKIFKRKSKKDESL